MENFIVVLISVGFVIYNIYRNFQKEVEKSKSRRPTVRPQTVPVETYKQPLEKVKHKEEKKQKIKSVYAPELPAEVIAAQERRRQSKIEKPIPLKRIQEVEQEKSGVEFDLRQAVIQSAILDRPYK
ncbi:hypothetical protein [Sphingobacterium litopenaei]|uniref:Uncharacterized protein n=1 Tax=Sphingobacterium litopenaei TaxID=2763500 RepID=A0ABR7YD79_9SPHI|nr:hypothetical protein [Sphingobacterium litopenaei]MBD1429244.1 hypothetical protein [Sphingobacterium litopenaei]